MSIAEERSVDAESDLDSDRDVREVPTSRLVGMGLVLLVLPLVGFALGTETIIQVETWQVVALSIALALRSALLLPPIRHRGLLPLVDLPLIGVFLIFTGGRESPLDPALFLIYALMAFSLERDPQRRWTFRYHVGFLVGFLGMNAVLFLSEWTAKDAQLNFRESVNDETQQQIRTAIAAVDLEAARIGFAELSRIIEEDRVSSEIAMAHAYFDPIERPSRPGQGEAPSPDEDAAPVATLWGDFSEVDSILHLQKQRLSELLNVLDQRSVWAAVDRQNDSLNEYFAASSDKVGSLVERMVGAFDDLNRELNQAGEYAGSPIAEWLPIFEQLVQDPAFAALDQNGSPQIQLHEFIRREYRDSVVWRWELRREQLRFLVERLGIAILMMAALSITAALRFRFEREVRAREAARVESEQKEKENWIALTAGLTHTIGNEILAYDAYAEEAIDAADDSAVPIPDVIRHNLQFIYENNKARLGFIKFLDEFARTRKAALDGRAVGPRGLQRIDIEPFLRRVRDQVGDIESADLPRDSRDPGVIEQRKKLLELPLDVEFADDASRCLSAGRSGVLQFFCYELLKNALRNCSGDVPLRVLVEKRGDRSRLRFINDVAIVQVRDRENGEGRTQVRLRRMTGAAPCTDDELKVEVGEILEQCFEPGRGGGTGLGLFLIRYFAREYYRGQVSAGILDWQRKLVSFDLELPDDLGAAVSGHPAS